jgi:hypothetical protein
MSDEDKAKAWWQTLPGIIAGITAMVTALAGLVVAVKQTGWFDAPRPRTVAAPSPTAPAASPPASTAPSRPAASPGSGDERAAITSPTVAAGTPRPLSLPAMRDYTLGASGMHATFTLLEATVAPRTAEKDALQIRVRMTNHNRYDANFWSRSFRLVVDGVPLAPDNSLNEVVASESAKDGDVIFAIPHGTARVKLVITHLDERTEIPLDAAPSR